MFSSIDKAIVAFIMAALYVANSLFGISFGFTEETVTAIVAALTPILVWLIPNRPA